MNVAPYMRQPWITGNYSDLTGIRGRHEAKWSMKGLPLIPPGTVAAINFPQIDEGQTPITAFDLDPIFLNIFRGSTLNDGTNVQYSFGTTDPNTTAFSIFRFPHSDVPNTSELGPSYTETDLTIQAMWGCVVTRAVFNFNSAFLTMDLTGKGGWMIDSNSYVLYNPFPFESTVPTAADLEILIPQGGLTGGPYGVYIAEPADSLLGGNAGPGSPGFVTPNGEPIEGFGDGYEMTIHSNTGIELKARALSITVDTGNNIVNDVLGNAYPIAQTYNTHKVAMKYNVLDDDSAALNDLKLQSLTDNVVVNATIVAGTQTGSTITFQLNNINLETYNFMDNGATVDSQFANSLAHSSSISQMDDLTITFS